MWRTLAVTGQRQCVIVKESDSESEVYKVSAITLADTLPLAALDRQCILGACFVDYN